MKKTTLALAAAGLLMSAGAVSAQSFVDDTFAVSATVDAACAIESTNALAFGAYNPVTGAAVDNATTVNVRCTNGHPYNIGLDVGQNPDGTARRMKIEGEEAFLDYELYTEAERVNVWGTTAGTDTLSDDGDGATQTHTIHGRIASDQSTALLGTYADIITVTVNY